jgi:hypothetical protein
VIEAALLLLQFGYGGVTVAVGEINFAVVFFWIFMFRCNIPRDLTRISKLIDMLNLLSINQGSL